MIFDIDKDQIFIRPVKPLEVKILRQIARDTFVEAFAAQNEETNFNNYVEKSFALDNIQSQLNNHLSSFYFVSYEEKIIGYLKLNKGTAQTELPLDNALEIERIYLFKAFHRKGIGSLMLQKAIEEAQKEKLNQIWLGVWEHNPTSIQFYKDSGFVAFSSHVFLLGEEKQTDILMKLDIENISQ